MLSLKLQLDHPCFVNTVGFAFHLGTLFYITGFLFSLWLFWKLCVKHLELFNNVCLFHVELSLSFLGWPKRKQAILFNQRMSWSEDAVQVGVRFLPPLFLRSLAQRAHLRIFECFLKMSWVQQEHSVSSSIRPSW